MSPVRAADPYVSSVVVSVDVADVLDRSGSYAMFVQLEQPVLATVRYPLPVS